MAEGRMFPNRANAIITGCRVKVIDGQPRGTKNAWSRYMVENPFYFESCSGLTTTPEHIDFFWGEVQAALAGGAYGCLELADKPRQRKVIAKKPHLLITQKRGRKNGRRKDA